MKNSLRFAGISIICWLGLVVVSASAATINSVETELDSVLNNNMIVGHNVEDYYNLAIPADVNDPSDTAGISSADLTESDVSFNALESHDTENIAPSSEATSSPSTFVNVTESSTTETVPLDAADTSNKFADNAPRAENSAFVQELELYAALLVCLGLLGFTARRRRDVI